MTANASNWVWKNSCAANGALIVLLAIAHETDRDGNATMSYLELSKKCRLSVRSAQLAVRDLVRSGELQVWPKTGEHARNGYRLTMSRGEESAPLTRAGYSPRHVARGEESARAKNLRGEESAPQDPLFSQVTPPGGEKSAPLQNDPHVVITTGRSEAEVKDVPANDTRPDVQRLCAHLADRIEANGSKRPVVTQRWRDAARLMIDRDGRTEIQITSAIDWCQDHEFWRANILSMPKLREKYEQLRLQASRPSTNGRATTTDRVRQAAEAGRRVQAMLQGGS